MPIRNINVSSTAAIATSKIATDSGLTGASLASSAILDRHLSANLRTGYIPLSLNGAKVVSSTGGESFSSGNAGFVSSGTAPTYQVVSTATRVQRLLWSSASAALVQFPGVDVPPDLSSNSSVTLNVLTASIASTDAGPTLNFTLYTSTSASNAAVAVPASSAAASTVPTLRSAAIPADQYAGAGYPSVWTFTVGVTSTQDQIALYRAWLTYARQSTA